MGKDAALAAIADIRLEIYKLRQLLDTSEGHVMDRTVFPVQQAARLIAAPPHSDNLLRVYEILVEAGIIAQSDTSPDFYSKRLIVIAALCGQLVRTPPFVDELIIALVSLHSSDGTAALKAYAQYLESKNLAGPISAHMVLRFLEYPAVDSE